MKLPMYDELTQRSREEQDAFNARIKAAEKQQAAYDAHLRKTAILRVRSGGAMPTVPILVVVFNAWRVPSLRLVSVQRSCGIIAASDEVIELCPMHSFPRACFGLRVYVAPIPPRRDASRVFPVPYHRSSHAEMQHATKLLE
jgi:hypothetical protein